MKQAVIDTSFIIAALEKKIDFFEDISGMGFQILIPEQVVKELDSLGAGLALRILEKKQFELIHFPGKDADSAIISFAKKNPEAVVATLDLGLKKRVKNKKMIIRGRKKIEVI